MTSDAHDEPLSDELRRLADAHGVSTEFWDYKGRHTTCSPAAVTAVLGALGVDAGSDEAVRTALIEADVAPWRRTLPPCVVVRAGRGTSIPVHVPDGADVRVSVRHGADERSGDLPGGEVVLTQDTGVYVAPREVEGTLTGRATFTVPGHLPLGWFVLVAEVDGDVAAQVPLAVTPDRLPDPRVRRDRGWGLMAQLYSVRSSRSWGIGDAADLASLTHLTGRLGGDFVLINPLHAAEVTGHMTPSPYLPTTRRFTNPIYIRPEDVREFAYLGGSERARVEVLATTTRELSLLNEQIDRDRVWRAKLETLGIVHAAGRDAVRQAEFDRYRAAQGAGLENYALWCALSEHYEGQEWPADLADVRAPGVERAREELAGRIDFYAWLQWVVDEQLEAAQLAARRSGMGMGIMHDLAVGVHATGADVWTMPDSFATGMAVGAPPDYYNQLGQDWSQPPWRPDALARDAYRPVRDMARTVLRHAGALRVDHVMGFFRLWWIPRGMGPAQGTYVRYDHDAMIGVLLLEAYLAGAALVGEDLGTVEPWVREYLAERGVLGTSVFWFEKDDAGYPRGPEQYRRKTLATVNTHDLPPAAGYLAEEHVDLRLQLGLLVDSEEQAREEARHERARTVEALRGRGLLPDDGADVDDVDHADLIDAIHRFVATTPAELVGISLVDAVGERRTQNQPGTDQEYPNWKVPLADGDGEVVLLDDLPDHPYLLRLSGRVDEALAADDPRD